MKLSKQRDISVFNISMLDVIASALGAVLIILVIVISQKNNASASAQEAKKASEALTAELKKTVQKNSELDSELEHYQLKSGFQIPLNVVFIVDISGSMGLEIDGTPQTRMHEVRAGLKMLLASLGEDRNVDILVYPAPGKEDGHAALWGELKPLTQERRIELYTFLNQLQPYGGTPARTVLHHALTNPNYESATSFIYLSDGIPGNPKNLEEPDDLNDLLESLRPYKDRAQISTIGIRLEPGSDAEKFMKALAELFGGFYTYI